MATSLGRHTTRDRDEARQDGTVSGEGLLQQQTEATTRELEADGFVTARGRGSGNQEEIAQVTIMPQLTFLRAD